MSVIISFVGIVLAVSWPEEKRGEAYFIMTSLRVAFWLITFVSLMAFLRENEQNKKNVLFLIPAAVRSFNTETS